MGIVNKPYNFSNGLGKEIDADQINANFDAIFNLINGNLDTDNVNSVSITKVGDFRNYIQIIYPGAIVVNNKAVSDIVLPHSGTLKKDEVIAHLTVAPVGSSLTLDILKNDVIIATITFPDGSKTGNLNLATDVSVSAGDYLNININSIGSTVSGNGLYIVFPMKMS